jgi:hypothetical protein
MANRSAEVIRPSQRGRGAAPEKPFHDLTQEQDDGGEIDDGGMPFHELAMILPMMEPDALLELSSDILSTGRLVNPIITYKGKILDGRNRWLALQQARVTNPQIEPWCEEFKGTPAQAQEFVISANVMRRHLSEGQRGMIMAEMNRHNKRGRQKKGSETEATTQTVLAKALHVSPDTGQRGKTVLTHGTQTLIDRVKADDLKITTAAKVAKLPKEEQEKLDTLPEPEIRQALAGKPRVAKPRPAQVKTVVRDREVVPVDPKNVQGTINYASYEVEIHGMAVRDLAVLERLRKAILEAVKPLHPGRADSMGMFESPDVEVKLLMAASDPSA